MSNAFWTGMLKAAAQVPAVVPPAVQGNAVNLIKHFEGFKPEAYNLPKEPIPTVGYGTHLTPDKSNLFSRLFGSSVDFNRVAHTNQSITPYQGEQLLNSHLGSVSNRLVKMMPKLPTYKPEVQGALLNGAYRGDMFQSPKAMKLMNAGRWPEASKEYLDNNEYRASITNKSGVKPRMDYNAQVFKNAK